LREVEEADAAFILGEDVANTAPRLALTLRQTVRRQPMAAAAALGLAGRARIVTLLSGVLLAAPFLALPVGDWALSLQAPFLAGARELASPRASLVVSHAHGQTSVFEDRVPTLTGFDPAAADFELIVPNQTNDMHSSWTSTGDAFLAAFVPSLLASPAFTDSVLFITWDEGTSKANGGGHIATIVATPGMTPGYKSGATVNHYSILRTIEQAWGLPLLGEAATAPTLQFPW
jgi:hypothetical protein